MGLLAAIFNINCGGLPREEEHYEEELAPVSEPPPAVCACNNCGRVFHETWLHHFCPARCGGRIYIK